MKLFQLIREAMGFHNDKEAEKRLKSKEINYFGPEMGPFACGHCRFFIEEKSYCNNPNVQAHTKAHGCCNLYLPEKK